MFFLVSFQNIQRIILHNLQYISQLYLKHQSKSSLAILPHIQHPDLKSTNKNKGTSGGFVIPPPPVILELRSCPFRSQNYSLLLQTVKWTASNLGRFLFCQLLNKIRNFSSRKHSNCNFITRFMGHCGQQMAVCDPVNISVKLLVEWRAAV